MKITRTINGQNITIELTAKELSDAWWEETIRKAVMAEFRKHINGDSPMDDVSAICERAYEANA